MAGLGVLDILEVKRSGGALSGEQIRTFIDGVVTGEVTRPQAAALLTSTFIHGMTDEETVALTLAMRDSGEVLSWPGIEGPFVDKHSTGGVGDKVSLVLAPLWATLGCRVPMISGRGLGHTGGTLDKLEAIEGLSVSLPTERLREILAEVGCFICGQTSALAPADSVLYALRNETATVPSPPLITASILSKKLAEGIDELVLDVKWGSGAFNKTRDIAASLAAQLESVGCGAGVRTRAVLTEMNQPLGSAVGNAVEVEEAIRCLRGEGPADLAELVCALIGDPRAPEVLASGAAWPKWEQMIAAQGGDLSVPLRGGGCAELPLLAPRSGTVTRCDAYAIGRAAFMLGAGRARAADPVHPGVGLRVLRKIGDPVRAGETLAILLHADRAVGEAAKTALSAYTIED
ncbi:MAG: thymidine phosphorylase [Myxococcota bacterium]|jgi:thymidine phosphorylase